MGIKYKSLNCNRIIHVFSYKTWNASITKRNTSKSKHLKSIASPGNTEDCRFNSSICLEGKINSMVWGKKRNSGIPIRRS